MTSSEYSQRQVKYATPQGAQAMLSRRVLMSESQETTDGGKYKAGNAVIISHHEFFKPMFTLCVDWCTCSDIS
jgi:hypothetical protein